MVDTFADKLTRRLTAEIDKKIKQICEEKPEIIKNHECVILWERDEFLDGETIKRYSFTLDGEEIASFCVGLEHNQRGNFRIKASDVVYLKI